MRDNSRARNKMSKELFDDYQNKYDNGVPIKTPELLLEHLTDYQRNFVTEFMKDLDGARAVLAAGYVTNNAKQMAWQLMRQPKVKLCIELLQLKRAQKSTVTKDYVLQEVVKVINDCKTKTEDGQEVYIDKNAALRGLETLARHLGMFIERTEITGKDGEAIRYEKIEEDARDFACAIDSLVERNRPSGTALKVVGGTES